MNISTHFARILRLAHSVLDGSSVKNRLRRNRMAVFLYINI